ncbi:hypothetical protein NKG05_27870 [Oerskovia sp. M15]
MARVVLDLSPHHLDRTFDYLVPASMATDARPGSGSRPGSARRRSTASCWPGRPRATTTVGSCRSSGWCPRAGAHPAGSGAVPDGRGPLRRHAHRRASPGDPRATRARRARRRAAGRPPATPPPRGRGRRRGRRHGERRAAPGAGTPALASHPSTRDSEWAPYRGGAAFLTHLVGGRAPSGLDRPAGRVADGPLTPSAPRVEARARGPGRAVRHWALALAEAVRATATGGRGALVVLPDARDVDQLSRALELLGYTARTARHAGQFVRLTADEALAPVPQLPGRPAGEVRIVIGTRAAAFAPSRTWAWWRAGTTARRRLPSPAPRIRTPVRFLPCAASRTARRSCSDR